MFESLFLQTDTTAINCGQIFAPKSRLFPFLTFSLRAAKAPIVAVNKKGSQIQVVKRKSSPPRRTLKTSSARRRETYGTMRSDEIGADTRKRKFFYS